METFKKSAVDFVETMRVAAGVECDVYKFVDDDIRDLGIIRIKAGCKTPRQKVLAGERTVEGYISGKGKLTIIKPGGEMVVFDGKNDLEVEIDYIFSI